MSTQTIAVNEQIKTLNEQIKALKLELPTKVVPQYQIDKRETIKLINNDLVTFNKVHKVVSSYLKNIDSTTFQALLSENQIKKFNAAQYESAKKSFKLVMKVTKNTIEMDAPYSTAKYVNDIIKVACISAKVYNERRR